MISMYANEWTGMNTLVFVATILLGFTYLYFKREHKYWHKRGFPYVPASFPFGNIRKVILRKENFCRTIQSFYTEMKSKGHSYTGLYFFSRKALLIIDPDVAKQVLTIDFQYFHDRGLYYDEEYDPLSANLVALSGEKWKTLRAKLTPTFSSGKLKTMFQIVEGCAQEMVNILNEEKCVEIKDMVARYTTDVIGSCAFGINCNSIQNPESEFRKIGRRTFEERPTDILKRMLFRSFPSLAKKIHLKVFDEHVSAFFMRTVVDTVEYRTKNNVHRADFLQLLIELMNNEKHETTQEPLTLNEAAAQAFVFFLAGFETSASTITFALYELACNADIQSNLRQEIIRMLKKNEGKFSYNGIHEMVYMEKVVQESLRKWPAVPMLLRTCTKNYQIPGTDSVIEKGVTVIIPTYALHHDPDYYPAPHVFDPERFESDTIKKRNGYTYQPFGNGPRICIGMRFAMLQIKVALAMLLLNFEFTVNAATHCPLTISNNPAVLTPKGGIWLNVARLSNKETNM